SLKVIHKQTGMLFQGAALFDFATVEENVRFPLDFFTGWTAAEKRERVAYCLNRVNLYGVEDKYPSELSGGMQKRVGIARAIVMNPKYLFCDEPNSGLDPQTAILIDRLISDITHEFHMTAIINTHDMNSVMAIGEKVVFIYKGEKAWEGPPGDIFQTGNKELNDFVFASEMAKMLQQVRS
ncbi:MAG: ATP-binding cassette domain-containing protein, partial [Bacteroidales bacterium]